MNGNIITKNIVISNIDKVPPVIYGILENMVYNKDVNITVRDELSGISKILIEKDGHSREYSLDEDIKLFDNGKYIIAVQDNSGNVATMQFEINIKNEIIDDDELDDDKTNDDEPYDDGTLPNEEGGNEYIEDNYDTTTINTILPNTGEKNLFIFITLFTIISIIMYIKFKRYKAEK